MTLLATIAIPTSPWIWPAVALLPAAVVLLVWSYRRAAPAGLACRIAFGLKLVGLLALAACLVEPLWMGRRVKSGANLFVVAADNSSGMTIRGSAVASRGEILQAALESGTSSWLASLSENFDIRGYVFDSQLRRTRDFSELAFDGKATAIGAVLRTLADRYRDRPLAGVLLMTDGCATDVGESFYDLSGLPPVYPVPIGDTQAPSDIALVNVSVSQTSFEDAPVTIQADVEAVGCAGRTLAIDLTDDSGSRVERRQWKVLKDDEKEAFRFRLRPDKTGILFYRLYVAETPDGPSPGDSETPFEATLANNERTVVVDRGRQPHRVLYVTGRPNWEYKFLQRAISEDEQIQLVGLIRVAKREPKYNWLGRTGQQSNPLYRGFDDTSEERTESYDQPVLVRIYPPGGPAHADELRDGFPTRAEDLFIYHAVVLDDVGTEFFSHEQMDLLRRFVTERGGGFLMLGGKESFRRGDFQRTPIGGLLPVHLDPVSDDSTASLAHLDLTREGWIEPWTRLRDSEHDERRRLADMPEFRVLNRVGSTKPGARIVATIGDDDGAGRFPALITQRLGRGRTAALTIGDIWRWGLRRPELRDDMNKFWRQTLRWLVADVPARISLQAVQDSGQAHQPIVLRVRARDEGFEPLDNVSVAINVREPQGRDVLLTATPVPAESGLFEAVYVPRSNGGYLAQAIVTDTEGTQRGDAEAGWAADLQAREFESVKANRPLLERIARQTGGRLVDVDELDTFARDLLHRDAPMTEAWIRPLWDLPGLLPAIFLFVLTCFVAEWALRRWRGMP